MSSEPPYQPPPGNPPPPPSYPGPGGPPSPNYPGPGGPPPPSGYPGPQGSQPYGAPPYSTQPYATTQLAGLGRRFLAFLIDGLLVSIVAGVIFGLINTALRVSTSDTAGYSSRSGLISLLIGLGYFGWLWGTRGQTLGYMALGMRLTRGDGGPVGVGRAIGRYLAIYVSEVLCLIPFIISAFMIGLSQRKQGIHDLIADTVVVRT
jgi:uncharacterized RDD family membrane protein YckC